MAKLEELDMYDQIEAVYGSSAGAFNGAFFLSRQTRMGTTIYLNDLRHNFVLLNNIPKTLFTRFFKGNNSHKISNLADIDYLFNIIETKKILNLNTIKKAMFHSMSSS